MKKFKIYYNHPAYKKEGYFYVNIYGIVYWASEGLEYYIYETWESCKKKIMNTWKKNCPPNCEPTIEEIA